MNIKSIGFKRKVDTNSSSSSSTLRTSSECRIKSCKRAPVILCKDKKQGECLIHYCCRSGSLFPEENKPAVIDNENLQEQFKCNLKDLWKAAIGDVAMLMYDAQKEEEFLMRNDPSAVIRLDSDFKLNTPLIGTEKYVGSRETLTLSATSENIGVKDQNSLISSSNNEHEILISDGISDNNVNMLLEGLVHYGDRCSVCESKHTVRRIKNPGYDVAKYETWGSSTAPTMIFDVICKACGITKTMSE